MPRQLSALVACVSLAGCSPSATDPASGAPLGDNWSIVMGVVSYGEGSGQNWLESETNGGRTVVVRFPTYAASCYRIARTDVKVSGLEATVIPYDAHPKQGGCTRDIREFVHEATVPFAQAGNAQIRVRGLDASRSWATPDTIEHVISVTVR